MRQDPIQVLQAGSRAGPAAARPRLLVAGATGVLGNEVLRRLAGSGRFAHTQVLAGEPMTTGVRDVAVAVVPPSEPDAWPAGAADVGAVMFDPPRLFYDRERALWTPRPEQLPALARWMRASGVRTLVVVLPHAPGRLPDALKRGLASLDEQAVAALGFERVLIFRSAQKPSRLEHRPFPERVARWMLSIFKYMVPSSEQPVRAAKVAELVSIALRLAPPGIHVAAPEVMWRAAQSAGDEAMAQWLAGAAGTPS